MPGDIHRVEYHSREWDALVERGWVTATVAEVAGKQVAEMYFPERWQESPLCGKCGERHRKFRCPERD